MAGSIKLTYEEFKNQLEFDRDKNTYNQKNIAKFAVKYIKYINENDKIFSQKHMIEDLNYNFYSTHIKNYLHKKLMRALRKDATLKNRLWEEFKNVAFEDNAIKNIAIKKKFYHGDLRKLFRRITFERLTQTDISVDQIASPIIDRIADEEKEYCKSKLLPILEKTLYLALQGGFAENLTDINPGVMKSNAGDGAEFIFVGRAILAGYNCSQVDVRTSSYDAIIDVRGMIYRVQIKGFSGESLSFETQTRGGQGVDSKHDSNKSKRITSNDCDLYVAVDKRTGICYIIPTAKIDEWNVSSKKVNDIEEYRENWNAIETLRNKMHT